MPFFAWFRRMIRDACLGGVNDALEQLGEAATAQPSEPVAVQLTLTVSEPKNRIGKVAK
jgi:hypothetical protein